jgi:hypothetical protein
MDADDYHLHIRRNGEIRVEARGVVTTIRATLPGLDRSPPSLDVPMPTGRAFSDLEEAAIRLLCKVPRLSCAEIAKRLNKNPEGDIKVILRNLAQGSAEAAGRGVLHSSPDGYELAVPAGRTWEDYAPEMLTWLTGGQDPPGAGAPAPPPEAPA